MSLLPKQQGLRWMEPKDTLRASFCHELGCLPEGASFQTKTAENCGREKEQNTGTMSNQSWCSGRISANY